MVFLADVDNRVLSLHLEFLVGRVVITAILVVNYYLSSAHSIFSPTVRRRSFLEMCSDDDYLWDPSWRQRSITGNLIPFEYNDYAATSFPDAVFSFIGACCLQIFFAHRHIHILCSRSTNEVTFPSMILSKTEHPSDEDSRYCVVSLTNCELSSSFPDDISSVCNISVHNTNVSASCFTFLWIFLLILPILYRVLCVTHLSVTSTAFHQESLPDVQYAKADPDLLTLKT